MTPEQLCTVLAALRYWQYSTHEADRDDIYPEYFQDYAPLVDTEIDRLCECLNEQEDDDGY